MSYNFSERAAALGFTRKLEAARHIAIADGHNVAIVKCLRSDEWEVKVGQTALIPDVVVDNQGGVKAFSCCGRRAIAQNS